MKTISFFMLWQLVAATMLVGQNVPGNRVKQNNTENGLALEGYDPVSYFKGKPLKGSRALQAINKGITYRFYDTANLEAFKKNPDRYEPAYGGWCAYAMGKTGEKVEVDPETYKVVDNTLYLFYNSYFNNTLPKWNQDQAMLKKQADANWIKIHNK